MLLLVQKLLAVVLAVDIQQAAAQHFQLSHRHRPPVHPADVFSVAVDLPLQQQRAVLLRGDAQRLRYRVVHAGEHCTDEGLVHTCTDQLAAGALPQHGAKGVDDDGLTRARFAGQGVEARLEPDVRLLDDGDILNMEHFQHGVLLPRSLAEHLLDLLAEIHGADVVVEHQENGVVAGQRPHDVRLRHIVQRKGRALRHTLDGLQHHQILRRRH